MTNRTQMARTTLRLTMVACALAAVVSAVPRHFPGTHSPYGFAADAITIVGVEESTFSCDGLDYGYYADQSLDCKGFHICMPNTSPTGRRREAYKFSFFCPNQTRFSQDSRTCISKEQAYPCHSAHLLYRLNSAFGQPEDGSDVQATPRARSSGLSLPAGASTGAPSQKSTTISSTDQREIKSTVSNLALQDGVRLNDQAREAAAFSKDDIASITSSRFNIDDSRPLLDDALSTGELDNAHTLSGSSSIDNNEDFILTSPSPSISGLGVNKLDQNTRNRFKGSRLNENPRDINSNVDQSVANKQTGLGAAHKNNAAALGKLENIQNIPRGRKVSGGNKRIVVSVNSLKNDGEEPIAEPEPEPEPVSQVEDKEHASDAGGISSKSNPDYYQRQYLPQTTSSTSTKVTPRQKTGLNGPLLVGPRPSLSVQGISAPRAQKQPSGRGSTKHLETPTGEIGLTDENLTSLQSHGRALPTFQNDQKPPEKVLSNIQGNFHQIGFQIIEHDQSTNLNRGNDPIILSPLAKTQKIPASLSLPRFDGPSNQQASKNSQQDLPVSLAGSTRGVPNDKLNNALSTNPRGREDQPTSGVEVSDNESSSTGQLNSKLGNRSYGDSIDTNPSSAGQSNSRIGNRLYGENRNTNPSSAGQSNSKFGNRSYGDNSDTNPSSAGQSSSKTGNRSYGDNSDTNPSSAGQSSSRTGNRSYGDNSDTNPSSAGQSSSRTGNRSYGDNSDTNPSSAVNSRTGNRSYGDNSDTNPSSAGQFNSRTGNRSYGDNSDTNPSSAGQSSSRTGNRSYGDNSDTNPSSVVNSRTGNRSYGDNSDTNPSSAGQSSSRTGNRSYGDNSDTNLSSAGQASSRRGNRLYGENSNSNPSSAGQSNSRRGNRLYGENSDTNQIPQVIGVPSPNSNFGAPSSGADQKTYLPQTVSPITVASPARVASFRVSDSTSGTSANNKNKVNRNTSVNAKDKQNAIPPPPLFENNDGTIRVFEAQSKLNENEIGVKSSTSMEHTTTLPPTVRSNKSYLPTQKSGLSVQPSGKIPGFSAGVRRINGKIIEGSSLPWSEKSTRKLDEVSHGNNQLLSKHTPLAATGKEVTENFSSNSRRPQPAQTNAQTLTRSRGRGRGSSLTSSQVAQNDASKLNENVSGLREQETSTSTPASALLGGVTTVRTNRRRNQGAGHGRGHDQRTSTQTAINATPASRNLRARGNQNFLFNSDRVTPKQFGPSKGHEVKTTRDLEILLDEDLDAATASLLAGIQPPQKSRHKKDSSSNEAPVLESEGSNEVTLNEPKLRLGIKSTQITGTVIPQRLFNPRQNTPLNRRATPGSITLGTVGSITTTVRNGEVNLNLLPTTTTTTTTPTPRTTRVPRSTTERTTTTRRPVNDKRGSVKFTPSPYIDLSWLGPTIRNRITNHLKRGAISTRKSQNSKISNAISEPPNQANTDEDFNPIVPKKRSSSTGFSLPKPNKISRVTTQQQKTSPSPISKSSISQSASDLDGADATTKAPALASLSSRRRTRNHRVKLRVNPLNDDGIEDAVVPSINSEADKLPEKNGEINRSVVDDQSKLSLLSSEVYTTDENTLNDLNVESESLLPTVDTVKTIEEPVGQRAPIINLSAVRSPKKLDPVDSPSKAENFLNGSPKKELDLQSVEATSPKEAAGVAAENIEKAEELNSNTARAPASKSTGTVDIRKKINTHEQNSTETGTIRANSHDSSEKVVENQSNPRSRVRNNARRKVVRVNKRPASIANASSSFDDKLSEISSGGAENSPKPISKRKPSERINRKLKLGNNLKLDSEQTKSDDEKKTEELVPDNNPNETGEDKKENIRKESRALEQNDEIASPPLRSSKRHKILLNVQKETLPENDPPVPDSISNPKKVTAEGRGRRIHSSEDSKNKTVQIDTRQEEKSPVVSKSPVISKAPVVSKPPVISKAPVVSKPPVTSRTRSRAQSRVRPSVTEAQNSNNSTVAVVTTSERSRSLETSVEPVVHRPRSRRISTRRRLIAAAQTTTARTNDDVTTEKIKSSLETKSTKQRDFIGSKTTVKGSSTEGTTFPTSQSRSGRRTSRVRFTTALPESLKHVKELSTEGKEDDSVPGAAATTEISLVSRTSASRNNRRRPETKLTNALRKRLQKIEDLESFDEASSTSKPASSTSKPASSTSEPASSTFKPASSTFKPASSTFKPASSTSKPASSTSESITEVSLPVTASPRESRRRLRTRVSATEPTPVITSQKSEADDNSLNKSRVLETNSSPQNRRGFRRTSRKRIISNKISTENDNDENVEDIKQFEKEAEERESRQNVQAEVQQQDDAKISEKSVVTENHSENEATTFPSVTLSSTTTAAPVNFANLFKINTANFGLEDEIQTIAESQNTRKTAVRKRKINALGETEQKPSKYFGGRSNKGEIQNLELTPTKDAHKGNSVARNENNELDGSVTFIRKGAKNHEETPDVDSPSTEESNDSSLRSKIASSKRKIQDELQRSTIRPPRRNQGRNRRLVKKVKLSRSEVPTDSLNNVYETLRSANSNATVKSNELSIPGLKPGLKLRVVGTSVKKSVSTSSAASPSPEKQHESADLRDAGATLLVSDSSRGRITKTRRKFASRRPVPRKINLSEELSVPQAAESRGFRTTIIRRKLNDES